MMMGNTTGKYASPPRPLTLNGLPLTLLRVFVALFQLCSTDIMSFTRGQSRVHPGVTPDVTPAVTPIG